MVDNDSITSVSNNTNGIFTGNFSFQPKMYGIFKKLYQAILLSVFGKKQNPPFAIKNSRTLKSILSFAGKCPLI